MRQRIFCSIFAVSVAVLILSVTVVLGFSYSQFNKNYIKSLKNEALCIEKTVSISGVSGIDALEITQRISLFDKNGEVLYDSQYDIHSLGSHADREEFKEAVADGEGYSERYSETVGAKTVNISMLLGDGTVLRVSDRELTVLTVISNMVVQLVLILFSIILISFYLAYRLAKQTIKPINEINLEAPEKANVYKELDPLIKKISAQNEQIASQMHELREEHEKQDTMRREFTANVSHELKTPLTSISGYAEIIRDGLVKPEDIKRFSGKIYDESQRLITLVGDIIKLSQLDAKEVRVRVEKIDLYETCHAVLDQLEQSAKSRNVTLSLSGEHIIITAAEQIVEEIVFNICDNAVKYNRPGGSVSVNIRQCVDGAELSVADTGIGISEAEMPHIFERFYRADKSHSKEIGGTGLGLSIVKHGAMFLGATVSVKSTPGTGTVIKVLF